ncbi:sensor histidine kinase [Hufsiella ginkgonis]|uniref:histidine kinase n=1 Tax=Hufsiella ginkgonis TaxID=2695274 RepID=A0A7K1Y1Z2_9SPHI|nr:sensor histidine kinase [Hufsiella ginkgonis]MXV17039.1 hypothetical protein [Hufsiella ginkgonis]
MMNYVRTGERGFQHTSLPFILLLILSAFTPFTLHAQKYNFTQYDIEQGLVQSQVMEIYQDPSNYLWFGTRGGLGRFDGKEFISFSKLDGLNNNMVTSIMTDRKGRVWIGQENGMSRIEGKKVVTIKMPAKDAGGLVRFIREDESGRLWLTSKSRLFTLVNNQIVPYYITGPGEYVTTLARHPSGRLYAAVWGKGIHYYDGKSWRLGVPCKDSSVVVTKIVFDRNDRSKCYLLSSGHIFETRGSVIRSYSHPMLDAIREPFLSMEQDAKGNLWVGTNNGAYWLRKKDPVHFNGDNGFKTINVYDIFRDSEDNIWLGTDGTGVFKFDGGAYTSFHKFNGLEQMFMPIARDSANNLWLGTTNNGLIKYDGRTFKNVYIPSSNPYSKSILTIFNDPRHGLLIGGQDGLWQYNGREFNDLLPDAPYPRFVRSVISDRAGTIWMAAPRGCFYLEQGKVAQVDNFSESAAMVTEVGRDSIMAGTNRGIWLIRNKKLDRSFRLPAVNEATVLSLLRYRNMLLVATFGDGLFVIDLHTKAVRHYTTRDGFYYNDIYSLARDERGLFWAGTGRGVNRFTINPKTLEVSVIRDLVKTALIECNQNSIISFDNKIWVGSTKGLYVFDATPSEDSHKKPFINLQSVKVVNQAAAAGDEQQAKIYTEKIPAALRLDHRHNRVLISFRGIFLTNPDDVSYRYRLTGVDEVFSQPIKTNMIEYPSLLPGTYTFEVKAVTGNGVTSNVRSITFTITPPFYQTLLFRVFVLVLLVVLIISVQYYWTYRKAMQKRVRRQIKLEEQLRIRRQTAEDFHDDIGNKLTRIAVLSDILNKQIGDSRPEQREIVAQIKANAATLYSGTKDILWALDPQSDNLYEILHYVHEFGNELFHNTDIDFSFNETDPKFQRVSLPMEYSRNISMIVKESLNNILKHSGAKQVKVMSSPEKEGVRITISDDGKGFCPDAPVKGRGLNNMRMRANRINGTLEVCSSPGKGTSYELFIPLTIQ